MADTLPAQKIGKWTFRLERTSMLQFHITSEPGAGGEITIEGHDISTLLDYLYNNRELIYKATHDHEGHHLSAAETYHNSTTTQLQHHVEPVLYFHDGIQRIKAD